MVQSLNTKALLTFASVVRRPALMVPHVTVNTISELNFSALKLHSGIQAVVFDKDNTLTAPYENTVHENAALGLHNAVQVFGREKVAILSNSAGTKDDPEFQDAKDIETAMDIAVIRHEEKKPGGLQEVLRHFELEDPAQLCIVGDRLLTDVVFGNLHGMLTVHTLPLCSGPENAKDNWTAKVIRPVENGVLYKNWIGSRALQRRRLPHKYWSGPETCPLLLKKEDINQNVSLKTENGDSNQKKDVLDDDEESSLFTREQSESETKKNEKE